MKALKNGHEVARELNKVRQYRQYLPEPLSDDLLSTLLEIARWTGSSRNIQPWHFIVVTDKEQLRQLSEVREAIGWVATAPAAIALVMNGANPASESYDEGRVTERLLIGTHLLGFGGGIAWYGDEGQQARAKEILGIPAERTARSLVALGPITTPRYRSGGGGAHVCWTPTDLCAARRPPRGREPPDKTSDRPYRGRGGPLSASDRCGVDGLRSTANSCRCPLWQYRTVRFQWAAWAFRRG